MKLSKENLLNAYRPKPFIGFEGIGSSIVVLDKKSSTIIKQSLGSHLLITFCLAVMGPVLSLVISFQWNEVKDKPLFILLTLFFFITIGWIYFLKSLIHFLGDRRIELRHPDRSILFYKSRNKIFKLFRADEISEVSIQESYYHSKSRLVPNYTLVLSDKSGATCDLVTSDQQEVIMKVKLLLTS